MTIDALIQILTRAGKRAVPVASSDGSRLLVLPENGRLLGLFPADGEANFLWTNPALADAGSAKTYFARSGWPNPGGDRTWLAPEIESFIGDPARPFETYIVPPALDPGNWELISATAAEVNLENRTRLHLFRPDREVGVRLSKKFGPVVNPLSDCADLQYAGYSLVTLLEVELRPGAQVRLGIWNLLQLPQPGAMLIPTRSSTQPQVFFGPVTAGELTVERSLVRWNMGPPGGDAKIGIKAQPLTDRAGYLHETATPGIWDLVVRQFAVDPAGDYADVLWSNGEAGWTFQACCVRNGAERFNELEYHVPAATAVSGRNVSRDESSVWAFRGGFEEISEAMRVLLGIHEINRSNKQGD